MQLKKKANIRLKILTDFVNKKKNKRLFNLVHYNGLYPDFIVVRVHPMFYHRNSTSGQP